MTTVETNVSVERAQQLLLEHTVLSGKESPGGDAGQADNPKEPNNSEEVTLLAALGRVAYGTISAVMDQPPFHRSPLDGFALYHEDLKDTRQDRPVTLKITQTLHAGEYPRSPLAAGEAARVMTGAPLPEGATCVIRQEDTLTEGDAVIIGKSLEAYENFCFRGEDLAKDTVIAPGGTRLGAAHIGVLAGQGFERVRVWRRPRVGVISTGSELTMPGEALGPGKIYDSNRVTLAARCLEVGAEVACDAAVEDDADAIAAALTQALPLCDMLVTTGGVSVGEKDYMRRVGEQMGGEVVFSGFAAKPGGPAFAMLKEGKLILCLSGNPFAAFASFELLAAPVIRKLAGEQEPLPKRVQGVMKSAFAKESRGRRFLRARMEGGDIRLPASGHASGALSALAGCNCLLDIPAGNRGLKIGDCLEVVLQAPS